MFNIRVYGVLVNNDRQVLVTDELIRGMQITKFCGGGLEEGEGTIDCLTREFLEEMNLKVEVISHLYTTDFFQQSAFNTSHQIISIYYYVKALEEITAPLRSRPFDFDEGQLKVYEESGETETFRFIDWDDFSEESVTLPIDKIVAGLVKMYGDSSLNPGLIELENERVRLEPLSNDHYHHLLPVAMHRELWQFTVASINSEEDFLNYFNEAMKEKQAGSSFPFAVYDKKFKVYAGSTRYGSISWQNKRLEIGWTWYAPQLQGSGINKACKSLLLAHGFESLQLNRVELKTSSLNLRSQQAMEKLGARKEGVFRKHTINANGTVRDTVYYSYIADEWEEIKKKYFSQP